MIDAYVRVSVIGIEVLTVDARVVVASVDTYLRFAEAVNRLDLTQTETAGLKELVGDTAESGAEGNNRAVYTPLSGQPGFVSGFVVTYTLISDGSNSVPEPTALALLATGWAAIGALKVFRRR